MYTNRRKKLIALAIIIISVSISSPAHAGTFGNWLKNAAEDVGAWTSGAWHDATDWVSGAWEDSVDWTEGAWDTVEDVYADIIDGAGAVITYTESGIELVAAVVENSIVATFDNRNYNLNTNEWRIKALNLQNQLDLDVPFQEGFMLGTHNSFNAKEYATGIRYLDPNHTMSMYDQLDAGARAINMDVHYFTKSDSFWAWEWDKELMLCHAGDDHVGCSTTDRSFLEGLVEVRVWLDKNPGEVIRLMLQDAMDGQYDMAAAMIKETLGDRVYRTDGECGSVPSTLTKRDILLDGAQVYITTSGACGSSNLQELAYNYQSSIPFDTADASNGICPSDPTAGYIAPSGEDRTMASAIIKDDDQLITAEEVQAWMACGANMVKLDHLGYVDGDDRITAAVWSWAHNEPNDYNTGEDCVATRSNGLFNDYPCTKSYNFACKNDAGDWHITDASNTWSEGVEACSNETNGDYTFSHPTSSWDNQQLMKAKSVVGANTVWIYYSDIAAEGYFVAGAPRDPREFSSTNLYTWEFRDDGKLQLHYSQWSNGTGNWNPWYHEGGACFEYFGNGKFGIEACDDVSWGFSYDNGNMELSRNPWGISGGACYSYLGNGQYGITSCSDGRGVWVLNDFDQLEWRSNPWGMTGGACYNYLGDQKFGLSDCY